MEGLVDRWFQLQRAAETRQCWATDRTKSPPWTAWNTEIMTISTHIPTDIDSNFTVIKTRDKVKASVGHPSPIM